MAIVSDIARQALSDTASDAALALAAQWVNERYREMVTKIRYRHLRRVGAVVQPATIIDGTVTLTQGSNVVTPDATALAIWAALPAPGVVGRFIRSQDNVWYKIVQFDGAAATLEVPYVIVGGAGLGYNLAARYLTLADDAQWLGDFMHMRLWRQLDVISLDELDLAAPSRNWAQGVPGCVADLGVTISVSGTAGVRQVEVYPYAAVDEVISYVYWSIPRTLKFDDEIPAVIPAYTLKEGILIDAMRLKASQAITMGKVDEAAYWRNEYRAQETVWKTKLADAARADRGVSDTTFIVKGYGSRYSTGWGFDIRTAHDQVYANWFGGV